MCLMDAPLFVFNKSKPSLVTCSDTWHMPHCSDEQFVNICSFGLSSGVFLL